MGTAQVQGELWGARATDWAELQEPAWRAVFETALAHAGVGPGMRVLDIGCGAGGALVIARRRGADVAGIDAANNLIAVARSRLPGARIENGEMEELPFADEAFDVVTGINSFQFAADKVRALREARRVCRRGGTVFMLTWGRREDNQFMTVTMSAVLALLPPPPSSPAGRSVAAGEETDEDAMRQAGLEPTEGGEFAAELAFPDAATAVRAIMSAGATERASRLVGEERVRDTIRGTLPGVTRADGSVAWQSRFHWTKARRPR
jgi:2-polyprenyl-3-methyl-5-hydroxy-6-metoxy-1,4-benzoquinol methylase